MRVRIECGDYEVVQLPHPLDVVIAVLSTYRDGYFVLDPKRALLTIYRAKRVSERILKSFVENIARGNIAKRFARFSIEDLEQRIEVRVKPLTPLRSRPERTLVIHIPKELREFEVDDDVAKLVWIRGDNITMSAKEFIKRLAWSVICNGIDLDLLAKLRDEHE